LPHRREGADKLFALVEGQFETSARSVCQRPCRWLALQTQQDLKGVSELVAVDPGMGD